MKTTALALSLLSTVVLLAGCTDGGGLAGPGEIGEGGDGDLFITGNVLDEEYFPVEGARVVLGQGEAETTTDASGLFGFGPLAPGEYLVTAEKPGYESSAINVGLGPEPAGSVVITLRALALDVPYHSTQHEVTFVICASRNLIGGVPCTKLIDYATGQNLSGSERFAFTFQIPAPGLADLLVEMNWQEQQFGREMLFYIQTPPNQALTAATIKYFAMDGPAVLRGWVIANVDNQPDDGEADDVFDAEPNKILYEAATVWSYENSTIPFTTLYINHRTDTYLTWFYNRGGPREFTALPDV